MTKSWEAVRQFARAMDDRTGNQPSLPAIYPDQMAPVARVNHEGERIIEAMRRGFPSLPNSREKVTTNAPARKPVVAPVAEAGISVPGTGHLILRVPGWQQSATWFALGADRPLFAFAGIWRPVTAARGTKAERKVVAGLTGGDVEEHLVFAFVTTEPNELVRPGHAKAMPVILTGDDRDTWLEADTPIALQLQHPFAAARMSIVAAGPRHDGRLDRDPALFFLADLRCPLDCGAQVRAVRG
jgi:putative SOS response-associated peptidase YedK